jgi:hypothetical protein
MGREAGQVVPPPIIPLLGNPISLMEWWLIERVVSLPRLVPENRRKIRRLRTSSIAVAGREASRTLAEDYASRKHQLRRSDRNVSQLFPREAFPLPLLGHR